MQIWNPNPAPGEFSIVWDNAGIHQHDLGPVEWQEQASRRGICYYDWNYVRIIQIPWDAGPGQYGPLTVQMRKRGPRYALAMFCKDHGRVLTHGAGTVFEECTFTAMKFDVPEDCVFIRCQFSGIGDPKTHPESFMFRGSRTILIDCDFIDTLRGPVFQTNFVPNVGSLILGLSVQRCWHCHNGCEGILAEGGHSFRDAMILHTRYTGAGPAILLTNGDGCLIRDVLSFDGQDPNFGVNASVHEIEFHRATQRGNLFDKPTITEV